MNAPRIPGFRRTSWTTAARCLLTAGVGASASLLLLVGHVFVPIDSLQIAALWFLGASLLCVWAGILAWRMPVFGNRTLLLFALAWVIGTALSVWLAGWGPIARPPVWRMSMQWVAFALSFVVGGLLLRALLRKRAAPVIGRLLSLVSPLIVLAVILVASLGHTP